MLNLRHCLSLSALVLAALVLGLTSPTLAHAQTAEHCVGPAAQVEFACHTWTEIAQSLKTGTDTILIPVGGTEQSGPYIAVGKHNVRAQSLADEIARQAGHTLVAPAIAYVPEGSTSPRTSHMRFPGTISIPPTVFEGLLTGAAESFRVQGFHTIVLLGDHGGYQASLSHAAEILNRRWKGTATALYLRDYYTVIPHQYADTLKAQGHAAEVGLHAELSDTSLMLATDPSLVRLNALRTAPKPEAADGVYGGDPRRATAELGQIGTDLQVNAALKALQSLNRTHP